MSRGPIDIRTPLTPVAQTIDWTRMKARIGVPVVLAMLATTAWFQKERVPVGQAPAISEPQQTEQKLQALEKASAEAWRAYEQAKDEAKRTWKIATQIRERDEIMDPAPHGESDPTSRSGNPDDLKAYLAAKQIYLRANAESAGKGDLASEATRKEVEEAYIKPRNAARAKADQTRKAALALRIKLDIFEVDPESETAPISLSGNPDDLQIYLPAKREYLKAKAELEKLEVRSFYSLGQVKQ
jgi:hypothetical protein